MKRLVTPPTIEPVSLEEAKSHLRVLHDHEDALIDALIQSAREQAESFTRRALIAQTWEISLDDLPRYGFQVFPSPLMSVESITYLDGEGLPQTLPSDQYIVVADPHSPAVVPAYGVTWPMTLGFKNCVTVRAVCGYGSNPGDVPAVIRSAMLLMIGDMYQHRETIVQGSVSEIPMTAERLMWPKRDLRE